LLRPLFHRVYNDIGIQQVLVFLKSSTSAIECRTGTGVVVMVTEWSVQNICSSIYWPLAGGCPYETWFGLLDIAEKLIFVLSS